MSQRPLSPKDTECLVLTVICAMIVQNKKIFANTPAGAQFSAVIYSLIETAKENKLDPYRYLLWILESAPVLAQDCESWPEYLIPANAPDECKTP